MAPAGPIVYSGQKETKNPSKKGLDKMMGKSRKYAVGNPGKMMPDYHNRPAVEITAESEGFGSSGKVDTEMTLSEDSCSPKRKRISLNGGGDNRQQQNRFGVPVQVLSLSKLSRLERKDLEVRLKKELEEIRVLQRRVANLNVSAIVVSPASDIRSCSDGQKRPPLESTPRVVPQRPLPGKKRPSPPGRNGPLVKKGVVVPVEPPRQAAQRNSITPYLMKQCADLLKQMLAHKSAWVFKEPVDVVKLNIPDYFTVIKHPMDFSTIKAKLTNGEYTSPLGFAADVRLTFSNAMTYNPPANGVHKMAQTMSKYFEQRWKAIEKKIPTNMDVQRPPAKMDVQVQNEVAIEQIPAPKKQKVAPLSQVQVQPKKEPVKKMTEEEKTNMGTELESLLSDLPESIIDFLKEICSGDGQPVEDEIELDVCSLSDDICFKLRKLLDDFIAEKNQQQGKAEPCEMELHNESGFSNSSIQPGKGNDAADEDVDIGGNDHPVSSFPPVEIERDTANKNSRCSSPTSSSSDSGSSSDSDSSSSESESTRAVSPSNKLQGAVDAKADQNQKSVGHDVEINQSRNSASQVEQTKPLSVEVDDCKDGESAPSERQVSPDKLYRAALLRSRFADTILKAHEKTLDKGEKRDPEKLRLDREELERKQREEKARLQAEAKAAEEARRKAEAEAAAEAKRKRELEREASRLALQQMEKTVEINENCQFMEDLELLGAAPADNLSTFMGDASPDDSQNGALGSFRFRGNSNPLEQLGLYRKDDDEEEEEVEAPLIAPDPAVNDVEEGEID